MLLAVAAWLGPLPSNKTTAVVQRLLACSFSHLHRFVVHAAFCFVAIIGHLWQTGRLTRFYSMIKFPSKKHAEGPKANWEHAVVDPAFPRGHIQLPPWDVEEVRYAGLYCRCVRSILVEEVRYAGLCCRCVSPYSLRR